MFIMKKLICLATLILFGTIIVPSVTVLAEDTSSVSSDGITEGETFSSNESAPVFDTFVEKSTEVINISSYEDTGSGEEVKTVIGEEDVVLATKINDTENNQTISVVNTGENIIVQKSILLEDGTYQVETETSPIIGSFDSEKEKIQDYNPLQRIYNGPWTYTHLAVGRNVFATIVDMGLGSWIGYFASLFRISRAAADFVFGYMGDRGISAGERLAKVFDSNGNGWVALYKRGVYRYKGAPLIGYQHRTF